MTPLYSFVCNNSCCESLFSDQPPKTRPPTSFRLRRRQRKREPATELPIRRQRAGSGNKSPDPAIESQIRPQNSRSGSRHRASDPVTESWISLSGNPRTPRVGFRLDPFVGFPVGSLFLMASPPFLVVGSLCLCRRITLSLSLSLLRAHRWSGFVGFLAGSLCLCPWITLSLSPSLSRAHRWSGFGVWSPDIDLEEEVLQMSITASNEILQCHFFFASKRQRLFS